jgi:hypothetical protein
MDMPLQMAKDPSPRDDLPSDIAFRFFLLNLSTDIVNEDRHKNLRYPERAYFEETRNRASMNQN